MDKEKITELVSKLTDKNNKIGCRAMEQLQAISAESDEVCCYLPEFFQLLDNKNSYVRNRALVLIAANAHHDAEGIIDKNLTAYLSHITDLKPITARQCIGGLGIIADHKPHLRSQIKTALQKADISHYADSMRPLVAKDIENLLTALE